MSSDSEAYELARKMKPVGPMELNMALKDEMNNYDRAKFLRRLHDHERRQAGTLLAVKDLTGREELRGRKVEVEGHAGIMTDAVDLAQSYDWMLVIDGRAYRVHRTTQVLVWPEED